MFCPKNEPHPPPIRLHLMCSITPSITAPSITPRASLGRVTGTTTPSQPLRATGPWGKQCGEDLWPGLGLLWGGAETWGQPGSRTLCTWAGPPRSPRPTHLPTASSVLATVGRGGASRPGLLLTASTALAAFW